MKITILNDNIASGICEAAHGLSYFVESDINVLFDAGPSDIAFRNAQKLGKNISEKDCIVLSHGHWDHGNGLRYAPGGKLVAHPEIFTKRYRRIGKQPIGLDISKNELEKKFELTLTKEPLQLSQNIWFLGEIPIRNEWDKLIEDFILENDDPDTLPDDSAIVVKVQQGMVIVTGCSHSGITNIVLHARHLFPETKLKAVIGGFHLKPGDKRLDKTIEFFKKEQIPQLYPSHCTAVESICAMSKELPVKFVRSGNVFRF